MALRFCDSFDHSATADLSAKWSGVNGGNVTIGAVGRNSTNGLSIGFGNQGLNKVLDSQATWIIGFAIKFDSVLADTAYLSFFDGVTSHVDLRINGAGKAYFTRNGTAIGSVGTKTVLTGVWYYFEVKVTIHDTTGVAVLKIDGVTDVNGSALDTRNAGNATADRFYLRWIGGGTNSNCSIDDLVVCDGTGSTNNDFLGDVRVQAVLPNGDGATSNLVGSDGNSTNNSLLVDESTPNGDTDYVESSTVGDKDTYAMGNVTPTTGSVLGVQVLPYARKTDAGARSIVSVTRLSGTEEDSAAKTLSNTYQYLPDIRETKPGGGAWSIADVNNMEAGVKVNA